MNFDVETPTNKSKKKQKNKQKFQIMLAIFFLLLSIILTIVYVVFINKEEKPTKKPQKAEEQIKEKLKIVDEDSNERPIAIMIDNNIGSAKHAGLQESYLNYEIIVEGGLTRIMALYKDKNVSLIGPVRSSRHYFLDYALESDAIYAHFGWSIYAERDIKALGVNNINGLTDDAPYWRESSAIAPHNVFTTTDKIRNYAKTKNYSTETNNWKLLNYTTDKVILNSQSDSQEQPNPGLLTANKISISYSNYQNRSYSYDSQNEYYLREMNGAAHIDKVTNNQLNYKNIIIEKVNNYNLDSEGRQDLATTGSGTGYYITNGYALPINWTKSSRSAKTKYTYTNGTEIKVNDGNTFIQIVPMQSKITIE